MSLIICQFCGYYINTDDDPGCFETDHIRGEIVICRECREARDDDERQEEWQA